MRVSGDLRFRGLAFNGTGVMHTFCKHRNFRAIRQPAGWPFTCLMSGQGWSIVQHNARLDGKLGAEPSGSKAMWIRSCAVCKELLKKLRLSDCIRCKCGWEW